VAIAMMVGGGGAPPLAAWLGPDTLDPHTGSGTVLFVSVPLFRSSGAHPALSSAVIACRQVLRMR
jgi:hypothetical protein